MEVKSIAKTTSASLNMESYLSGLSEKLSNIKSIEDFEQLDSIIEEIHQMILTEKITQDQVSSYIKSNHSDIVYGTLQGLALTKPYGYAGDFSMIDKIYTHHITDDSTKMIWDQYFQMTDAVEAVRNRKAYFKKLVKSMIGEKKEFSILNLASGPCRDVKELLDDIGNEVQCTITCLDMDSNAIEYAKNVLGHHAESITFINKNIFRFTTDTQFDLVWSAGLFDYFDDKAFVSLLSRAQSWVRPKGMLVIGNFNQDHNPTRPYMEIFGEWYLNHRTEKQLLSLAQEAGANPSSISVGREEANVNLFLHINT